jgi:NAD(P)H-hydrate epimerase
MHLTRQQLRDLDRLAVAEFGMPAEVLMENAGRSAVELLLGLGATGPVVICCGKGNNGGDGFVVARHLDLNSVPLQILLFGKADDLRGEAKTNFTIIERAGLPLRSITSMDPHDLDREFATADWIVDALYGTGFKGSLRAPMDEVVSRINASGRPVLAIDIPSGLDCDTGIALGPAVRARHTITFVASKVGFQNPAAASYLGQVHVAGIGVPRALLERFGVSPLAVQDKGPGQGGIRVDKVG